MATFNRRTILMGAASVGVVGAAAYGGARLLFPWHIAEGTVFNVDGLAIRGADPVAFFTEGKPVIGSSMYALELAGVTWHFASSDNRSVFKANPTKYVPQYGGYCAWAVAAKGQLYSTQPANWSVVDDKLYLNFNDGVQDRWNADIPGFISEGDRRWPELRDQLV